MKITMIALAGLFVMLASSHAAEFGDKRDKPGEVQKLLVPRELIPSSAPRTAEDELKSFQIAPGFRVKLVAGDPLVQGPVVIQIGPDGRVWVVEMRGFMADLNGVKEADPVGDFAVLEDTDGDGVMDKRTVFQDGLIMPRALLLVGDGLLVGAPPLVDSEWVLGSEQRLVRILLHGLTGPLSAKGRCYRLDMPAMGAFNDEQLSGILTYIRREWEHNAAPVDPDTIRAIRTATVDRHEAWLQEALRDIR